MKELTSREIAAVKRQFKNSLPALQKIQAINKKIVELVKEKAIQEAILEGGETGIKALTSGYKSTDLITCTYEPQFNEDGTPKMDKDGKYQQKKQVLTFHEPVEPVEPEAETTEVVEETTTEEEVEEEVTEQSTIE